ncbi:hypothetical protein ACHAW6_004657 [Cyclotella cf. meneghiniana]
MVMVYTSPTGRKTPLTIIRKSKNPRCFDNQTPPANYHTQANAWSLYAILLLDNCSAHAVTDDDTIPKKLKIWFFPPMSQADTNQQLLKGCHGLDYGGKATRLDAEIILSSIWDNDAKYAKEDVIVYCWQKADIFPTSWNSCVNNSIGSNLVSVKIKVL